MHVVVLSLQEMPGESVEKYATLSTVS